mgnify:CR=1 FL=1
MNICLPILPIFIDMKSCVVDKYGQEVDVAMVGLLIDKAKNALGWYFKYNYKLQL